jgi:hypothetical protein
MLFAKTALQQKSEFVSGGPEIRNPYLLYA